MAKDKNALACSRVFHYIASSRPGKKEGHAADELPDGRAPLVRKTSAGSDTDFEYLADESIVRVVCTGLRCEDYKLRCLMAGRAGGPPGLRQGRARRGGHDGLRARRRAVCALRHGHRWSLPIRYMTR